MANMYKGGYCKEGDGGKPSLGFSVSAPMKAAHGHFAQEKFLREGHNTVPGMRPLPTVTGASDGFANLARGSVTASKAIDSVRRRVASQAIRAGGETGAAIAAERPVLAARIAARQAGASRKDTRAAVKAARLDPNSARMERKAARAY